MGEVNSPPASSGHLFQSLKADFHLMKLKVVLLSEMLQPYRVPVFNALAERDDLEFHVLLLSIIEANREWDVPFSRCRFEYTVLPSRDIYIHSLDWGLHFNKGVTENLDRLNPDVIVGTGYSSPTLWIAQHWAKKHKRGYVLWSGSTEASSRLQNPLMKAMKRLFIRRCDAFLTYGSEATRTIANLGASPDRIVTGCNTVDIDDFARITEAARNSTDFPAWRQKFPQRIILFVGQMIERKGVADLLAAFRRVQTPDAGLILVGNGPLLEEYKNQTRDLKNVFWEGYVQSSEMGPYLAAADVLVMPSLIEVWGLVVNEAMAAGVPVIATTCSGSTRDLIEDGKNGYGFTAGDVNQLSGLLESVIKEPSRWESMGQEAALRIRSCSPTHYGAKLREAAQIASGRIPTGAE